MSSNVASSRGSPQWWEWLTLTLLVALFAGMALVASPQKSASFDEGFQLTAGYTYVKTGDYRLATTHPPLAGMIAALTLLGRNDIALPLDDASWQAGDRYGFSDLWMWYAGNDVRAMLEAARRMMVLLGALVVVVVWAWARRLVGAIGGLLAAMLAAFDPNLIANSRQVTTDISVTLFVLLAMWLLWLWLERGDWWFAVAAGAAAGAAMGAKYNGLLLWPMVAGALLLYPTASASRIWMRRLGALALMGLTAGVVLWAIYRFDGGTVTVGGAHFWAPAEFYWNHLLETVGGLVAENETKADFLLGQVGTGGWWFYFPVAIGVKTPLATLVLLVAGLAAMVWKGGWRRQGAVWLPPLSFVALGLTGILTIGYRHLLPALPFAFVLSGNNAAWLETKARRWVAVAGAFLVGWLAVSSIWFYPHHDSYFNEAAGSWQNWSRTLVDSNLDWGQDLPALAEIMEQRGIERVNLAYFGKAAPEMYGVEYSPLPGFLRFMGGREVAAFNPVRPEPGWYAISATSLRLGTLFEERDLYHYFETQEPVDRAGYSIYLYEVKDEPEAVVLPAVVTGAPVYTQPAEELGGEGSRVHARWRESEGTVILPGGVGLEEALGDGYHEVGADFAGVFTLEGYEIEPKAATAGGMLNLRLVWQRGGSVMPMPAPTRGEPISAFVHVTGDDPGQVVAQADGWNTALRGLLPGDVLIQNMEIALPDELAGGNHHLLVGLYSPQNGERLTAQTAQGEQNFVELGELEVTSP